MNQNYNKAFKRIAQIGLISKGVMYLTFGGLILMAVFGRSDEPVQLFDIIKFIIDLGWLGRVLVILLTTGILCYSAWKFLQMVFNIEGYPTNIRGYFVRLTWLGPFLFYLVLGAHAAVQLYRYYFGSFTYSIDGPSVQEMVYTGWGKWAIAFFSVSLLVNAGTLLYLAFSGKYIIMLTGKRFYSGSPRLAKATGFAGYLFYGLALFIMSVLFAAALYYSDASMARGGISMFDFLRSKPFGIFLLMAIALGTMCYGVYFFLASFYRWREV